MYLDTAVLVKLLVREPDSSFYANQAQGQLVWTADLALTECYSALLRKEGWSRRFAQSQDVLNALADEAPGRFGRRSNHRSRSGQDVNLRG